MEDLISLHNLTSLSGKSTFQPEVQEHCLWTRSSSQQSCWVHHGNLAQNDVQVTRERHYSLLQTGVYQKSATNVGELQTKEQLWSHSNASTFKLLNTNDNRKPTSIKKMAGNPLTWPLPMFSNEVLQKPTTPVPSQIIFIDWLNYVRQSCCTCGMHFSTFLTVFMSVLWFQIKFHIISFTLACKWKWYCKS